MDYKQAFFSKLEDCYLGVRVKNFHQKDLTKAKNELEPSKHKAKDELQKARAELESQNEQQSRTNGFSNLMQIKYKYFTHIKAYLEKEIDAQRSTWDKNDIYNKLFTFFDSYLNDTGTPFFTDTPIYKNIYAKIYSNSKDTSLFYKTQNLYYVKSDTLYQSLILSDENENYEVVFDTSECNQNADNTKNKIIFKFAGVSKSGDTNKQSQENEDFKANTKSTDNKENKIQILIKITNQKDLFPELSKVFKDNSSELSEDFLKDLKHNKILKESKIKISEDELKKIFRAYKKQQEIDFFIHKDAKSFLEEQFDLWMFNHLYKEQSQTQWDTHSIQRLQTIRKLAFDVIRLIAAFENELKALWLKPKFAKKTQYVFSLDVLFKHCTSKEKAKNLLELLTKDKGFTAQIVEWQELNLIDESFDKKDFIASLRGEAEAIHNTDSSNTQSHNDDKCSKYRFLPLDTKHFEKDTRYAILSCFENLDEILNGELIKADNFQALNTLMPKYQGKIDLIYIDPPFNLGENASFDYKVNFKDSTWASLLDSRLELGKEILSSQGSIFVRCDYNGNFIVRSLLNNIFGEENFVNEIIVSKSAKLTETIKKYHSGNDSLFFFSKSDNYIFNVQGTEREERKWRTMHLPGERWSPIPNKYIDLFSKKNLVFKNNKWTSQARIILGNECLPPKGRHWALSQETIFELEEQGEIKLFNGIPKTQENNIKKLTSNWTDWVGYSSDWGFQTENHEKVLQRVILTGSNKDSIILDYHLGSGTTAAVAQKLGRKYVGVEMGEHFYSVIVPRMKKVLAGFASGISKELDYKGGGAFCYYELESYEEALKACEYVLDSTSNAIFDYKKSRKLIKELDKGESIKLDMSGYRKDFDIFVSLANLMGLKIKRLFLNERGNECAEFDNEVLSIDSLELAKYPRIKSLIFWN